MSELKVILATPHPKMKNACDGAIEVYLKSEADKVIADLEENHKKEVGQLLIEIAELKKQVHDYAQGLYVIQAKAEKETSHQKYKRCLALKEVCLMELDYAFRDPCVERSAMKCVRWRKWANRWHDLAEQFKEAK